MQSMDIIHGKKVGIFVRKETWATAASQRGEKGEIPKDLTQGIVKDWGNYSNICKSATTPRVESAYIFKFRWYITAFFTRHQGAACFLFANCHTIFWYDIATCRPKWFSSTDWSAQARSDFPACKHLTIHQGRNRNPPMSLFHLQPSTNTGFSSEFPVNFIQLCQHKLKMYVK